MMVASREQALDAAFRLLSFATQTMNDFDTAFYAAEAAAQAAAEGTVDRLYARADQARGTQAAVATAVVIAAGMAIAAAWRSPLGRKARNKIAAAIKAD